MVCQNPRLESQLELLETQLERWTDHSSERKHRTTVSQDWLHSNQQGCGSWRSLSELGRKQVSDSGGAREFCNHRAASAFLREITPQEDPWSFLKGNTITDFKSKEIQLLKLLFLHFQRSFIVQGKSGLWDYLGKEILITPKMQVFLKYYKASEGQKDPVRDCGSSLQGALYSTFSKLQEKK